MRWPIIRLIWLRELRDQFRDRRTMLTIVVLPLVIYPLLNVLILLFATQLLNQPSTVAIVGGDVESRNFPCPPRRPKASVVPALGALTLVPVPTAGIAQAVGASALVQAGHQSLDYYLLIEQDEIPPLYSSVQKERLPIFAGTIDLKFRFFEGSAKEALRRKKVDLIVSALPDFMDRFLRGEKPVLMIEGRRGDDRSRRAAEQMTILLGRWEKHLKEVRLRRAGLPDDFDAPFIVDDVNRPASEELMAAETLLDILVRTFPIMLVMWSLVGAMHPAIDLCAGEKERGTMETLLISPAGRAEIVYGKFLTIWVFSAGTAVLHLISMSLSTWQLREYLPQGAVTVPALFWCVVLVLPLSALFSAISLAVGAYARSSKEGQYYVMPMFWLMMPLALLTFSPDVELNQFYSMLPVTGVALLMQRLMMAPSLQAVPWFYFLPVFGTILLYSWLALRWAIWQFQREEVLFRDAERLNLGLLVRQFFGRKEASPSLGHALLCFGILFALRWISSGLGHTMPLMARMAVVAVAFVAAPPLFMSLLLTTRPRRSLGLRWPHASYLAAALLLLPLAELVHYLFMQFPTLADLFRDRRSLIYAAYQQMANSAVPISWTQYIIVLGLLPAICKEIAFRGFILNGLRRRFSAWPAILLSSFIFAVYHMNVFALVPFFLLGLVTGYLAVRSGSLIPSIILHGGCTVLLIRGPLVNPTTSAQVWPPVGWLLPLLAVLALLCTGLVVFLFAREGAEDGASALLLFGRWEKSRG